MISYGPAILARSYRITWNIRGQSGPDYAGRRRLRFSFFSGRMRWTISAWGRVRRAIQGQQLGLWSVPCGCGRT